ncbi:hypothetical protein [Arenibacter algicola]|uniref:Lipoprotein n=1 Tax=Arenibacter algicola TaxID=616991 RepID=A0A221UW12_9FLAO|nr:hypothetical protein [Arenibacter algicola]ASO05443.1 hypothetical protein AREALGSMS7_01983 [Arenibacter algicola]|tara:strand:+ start:1141 stop:1509 length:369 start_codon:yes stop_codon:yes gene_type:complete
MKKMTSILFLFGVLMFSCEKESSSDEYSIEAEVLGRNTDCGIYAVKILNGLSQVQSIVGSKVGDSIYIAKNLPTELETAGLKILLDVRKPQNDELGPCTTLGPAYYWLFVKRAEKKETSIKS